MTAHPCRWLALAALLVPALVRAEDPDETAAESAPAPTVAPAPPLVVTASTDSAPPATPPEPEPLDSTGRASSVLEQRQLEDANPRTAPEALAGLPGVTVQQTSPCGGSPIIRGLVGNQVLVLVDGIRLNNAIWRTGPLQYLNTIDPEALDRVEVLRGPASVRFGSDALGGVVQLHTKSPHFLDEGFDLHGELAAGYRSAADAKQVRIEAASGSRSLAVRGGGDLAEFGNLRGGRATGVQDFSSYRQGAAEAKVLYEPLTGHLLTASYLGMRQLDAPRPDKCSRYGNGQIKDCRTVAEQNLDLAGLGYRTRQLGLFDDASAQLSLQNFHELTERLRWDRGRLETKQDDDLVLGGSARLAHSPLQLGPVALHTTVGGEVSHDLVDSQAWRKSLRSLDAETEAGRGEPMPADTTVADDSQYTAGGLFVEERLTLGRRLSAVAGARFSGFRASAADASGVRLEQPLDRSFGAPSASLFGEYRAPLPISVGLGVAHGFRAPNLYDLTGRDVFGGGYEFADAVALGPERITSIEGVWRFDLGPLGGAVAAYASALHDLIVRRPGLYQGRDRFDGELVFKRQNAGLGLLWGAEAEARLELPAHTEAYGTLSYCYGQDITNAEPLSRIPPPNGTVGLRSYPVDRLMLGVYSLWALAQTRLSARDLADSRIPAGGTPGYFVLGLRASFLALEHVFVSAALHNLLDTSYRVHGSGVDEAGVEGQLRVEVRF
ncbi:MAG: TonB-dependent receptor [Deltaproteobacteria bacterium]|nr:TonB-dependent receptor [Deltaproteobacteria bacterium]